VFDLELLIAQGSLGEASRNKIRSRIYALGSDDCGPRRKISRHSHSNPEPNFGISVNRIKVPEVSMNLDRMKVPEASTMMFFLVRFIIGCGLPFSVIESPFFRDFVKAARPSFLKFLPSRFTGASRWIDIVHRHTLQRTKECVATFRNRLATFAADGYKISSENKKIVNFCKIVQSKSFYLSSVEVGETRDSPEWNKRIIEKALRDGGTGMALGDEEVYSRYAGVVTDNPTTMKVTYKQLEIVLPKLFYVGCASHNLDLLAEDLSVRIPEICESINKASQCVSYLKNDVFSTWERIANTMKSKPKKPRVFPETRSAFAAEMLRILISNRELLRKMEKDDLWREERYERDCGKLADFQNQWKHWRSAATLFQPIHAATDFMGSSSFHISWVYCIYIALGKDLAGWGEKKQNPFSPQTRELVVNHYTDRWCGNGLRVGLYEDVHLAAYVLNPLVVGIVEVMDNPIISVPNGTIDKLKEMYKTKISDRELEVLQFETELKLYLQLEAPVREMVMKARNVLENKLQQGEKKVKSNVDEEILRLKKLPSVYELWERLTLAARFKCLPKLVKRLDAVKPSVTPVERMNDLTKALKSQHRCSLTHPTSSKILSIYNNLRTLGNADNAEAMIGKTTLDSLALLHDDPTSGKAERSHAARNLLDPLCYNLIPPHIDAPHVPEF